MEAIEIFKELREVLKEIFGVNIPDRVMADWMNFIGAFGNGELTVPNWLIGKSIVLRTVCKTLMLI